MSLEKPIGRRCFVLAAGGVASGALTGRAQQQQPESGVKLASDQVGLGQQENGLWGRSLDFHRDTSAPFKVGTMQLQWVYEMTAKVHTRTETGAAPTRGVHRWILLNFLATPRLTIRERHPKSDGRIIAQWPMDAVSAAVLVETELGEVFVHEPVGHLQSRSNGIKLNLMVKVEKIEDGRTTSVRFWPAKPDFTGFDEDAALAELGARVGVPRKSIHNHHPVGSMNSTNGLSFSVATA